jgi:hypothetical protein
MRRYSVAVCDVSKQMLLVYFNNYTHSTYYVLKTLQLRNRYISKLQAIYTYLYSKAEAYYDNHNETKVN